MGRPGMQELMGEVVDLKSRIANVYIYGTGVYGRNVYNALTSMGGGRCM